MRRRSFSSEAKGSSEAIDGLGPGGGDSEREGEGMWLSPGGWVFPLLLAGVGFHVLDLSRRRMGQAEVEGVSWAGTINGRCCCVFPIVIPANNSISRPPPPGGGATVRSRSFPLLHHPMPLRYATLRRDQTESQPSLYTKSHAAAQERPLIRNAEPANHGMMMMQVFPTKQ